MERVAVVYKETGASRSIPRESFDPAIHGIDLSQPEDCERCGIFVTCERHDDV